MAMVDREWAEARISVLCRCMRQLASSLAGARKPSHNCILKSLKTERLLRTPYLRRFRSSIFHLLFSVCPKIHHRALVTLSGVDLAFLYLSHFLCELDGIGKWWVLNWAMRFGESEWLSETNSLVRLHRPGAQPLDNQSSFHFLS